jgi:hypothetical protein
MWSKSREVRRVGREIKVGMPRTAQIYREGGAGALCTSAAICTTLHLHQTIIYRRTQRRMVGAGKMDRDSTMEVPRRDRRMDQTPPSGHKLLAQRRQPKTLVRTRENRHPTGRHPEKGNPTPIP